MRVDQRNSGTLRNRRLFKMRQEVSRRLQASRDMYAIGKHPMELDAIIKYEAVLAALHAIRESMTAKAPKHWQDLAPRLTEDMLIVRREEMAVRLAHRSAQGAAANKAKAKAKAEAADRFIATLTKSNKNGSA